MSCGASCKKSRSGRRMKKTKTKSQFCNKNSTDTWYTLRSMQMRTKRFLFHTCACTLYVQYTHISCSCFTPPPPVCPCGPNNAIQVPVSSTVQYIFNVAMRDSRNITSAYRASNMSFSFTTYQECVADPGCQSQVCPSVCYPFPNTTTVVHMIRDGMALLPLRCWRFAI